MPTVFNMTWRSATSSLRRRQVKVTSPAADPRGRRGLSDSGTSGAGCSEASIWTLTLRLIAYFLMTSFIAALLATRFRWLA